MDFGFNKYKKLFVSSIFVILIILPTLVSSVASEECKCDEEDVLDRDKSKALRYKIAAFVSILVASAIGVSIPLLGKIVPALSPEKDIFFIIKAFATGVILATGFIHVFPDAFENLTSSRLKDRHPWADFPFTGFVAMCTAMGTLMVDTYATAYFTKHHLEKGEVENTDVEKEIRDEEYEEHAHVHTHASHGHSHGPVSYDGSSPEVLLRHRVISQVYNILIKLYSKREKMKGKTALLHPREFESDHRLMHLSTDAVEHTAISNHRLRNQKMGFSAQYLSIPKTKPAIYARVLSQPKPYFSHSSVLLLHLLSALIIYSTNSFSLCYLSMASTSKQGNLKEPDQVNQPIPIDEAEIVSIPVLTVHLDEETPKRMLAGKLFSPRHINRTEMKNALSQLWEECGEVNVTKGGGNVYSFTFQTQEEAEMILSKSPWFVLNQLLSLQVWGEAESSNQVCYDLVPFWLQVHGLPIKYLHIDTIQTILSKVGPIVEIENPIHEGSVMRPFGRAKLKVDVTKPFWTGCWVDTGKEKKVWVHFKYERLQSLCFNCGYVGHDQKTCDKPKAMASFDKSRPKYGSFLSAYPPNPLELLITEKTAFKNRLTRKRMLGSGQQPSPEKMTKFAEVEDHSSSGSNRSLTQEKEDSDTEERGRAMSLMNDLQEAIRNYEAATTEEEECKTENVSEGQGQSMKEIEFKAMIDLTGESDQEVEVEEQQKSDQEMDKWGDFTSPSC